MHVADTRDNSARNYAIMGLPITSSKITKFMKYDQYVSSENIFSGFWCPRHFCVEPKKSGRQFFVFKKLAFWRSWVGLSVTGTFVVKSYCLQFVYFWGEFLGEGVNKAVCVFDVVSGPKMTSTIWCLTPKSFRGQALSKSSTTIQKINSHIQYTIYNIQYTVHPRPKVY